MSETKEVYVTDSTTDEEMTEVEAIDIALAALKVRVEQLKPSARFIDTFQAKAPDEAIKDFRRRSRYLRAMDKLRQMKWAN